MEAQSFIQRDAFLDGEGDQYFRRNPLDWQALLADPWNQCLAEYVVDGGRVLEIGCADGRRLATIGELSGVKCSLRGVDPSVEAIRQGSITCPHMNLSVGTADHTGVDGQFDLVLLGFCMYLCDRSLLFKAVAEVDRLVSDGGVLAIIDFDPPYPQKRRYHHLDGLWSYKMDYPGLFLASPSYAIIEKRGTDRSGPTSTEALQSPGDRVVLTILSKTFDAGYVQGA